MSEQDELKQLLDPLADDVPPMPEHLHNQWMEEIQAMAQDNQNQVNTEPAASGTKRRVPGWKTLLAAAAALVFVVTGAIRAQDKLSVAAPQAATKSVVTSTSEVAGEMARSASVTLYANSAAVDDSYAVTDMYDSGMAWEEADVEEEVDSADERKLIRTISLSLSSRRYDESLEAIKAACEASGGMITYMTERGDTSLRTASLTLRIPANVADSFLESAEAIDGTRVLRREESTEDVTENYRDTASRLENQKALLARLRALTTDAADLSDVLMLEAQMAETQATVDRLTASLQRTDQQVTYTTVTVSLREESATDEAQNSELGLFARLWAGLKAGISTFGDFLAQGAVLIAAALPFAAAAAVIWLAARLLIRRHRQRKAADQHQDT